MILVSIFYAIVGISILIFVHELGHFLAAKKVGVRVERFAIGFDPSIRGRSLRLFSFRRGETEYVLGAIPLGGYVKLAGGEMLHDTSHKPAPDELPGKSVGARALVFVAGSVMNVMFAFIFFMVAFSIGVPFPEPRIGSVVPGSPAWKAGLRPDDQVLSIDGENIMEFGEIRLAAALGSSTRSMNLTVSRVSPEKSTSNLNMALTPRWDSEQGFNVIGVREARSGILASDPGTESLAGRSGLKKGDRILGLKLGDFKVAPAHLGVALDALSSFQSIRPGVAFQLLVARDGKELALDVHPRRNEAEKPQSLLGIDSRSSAGVLIRDIHPASAALKTFQPRDRVVAVQGEPVPVVHWLDIARLAGNTNTVSLTIENDNGESRAASVPTSDLVDWLLGGEILWDEHRARLGKLDSDSPLAQAGLVAGDLLTHFDRSPIYAPEERAEVLDVSLSPTISVRILRDGTPRTLSVQRSDLLEARGVTWESTLSIKAVVEGGPAAVAGITPGSRILHIGGRRVYSWLEMREEIERLGAGAQTDVGWVTGAGELKEASTKLELPVHEALETSIEFEPLDRLVKVPLLETFSAGAKRTLLSAKQIFLTLRSLVSREVSPKNLSGPLGITHFLTLVAQKDSWGRLIYIMALISINLGLFNLLPFPILDGGHLLFLGIEKVKGSPVSVKAQEWAMNLAFLAIMFLFVFVTFNDVRRIFP